jgi:hypothetical protein
VDADSYVLQLVRYIHRNPLEAGLVKRMGRFAWSSHKGYLSLAKKWNWLHKDFVLRMLTENLPSQIQVYKQLMTLNRYSSVSSVVMRVKTKLQKDRKFKERLNTIEYNILKSQS